MKRWIVAMTVILMFFTANSSIGSEAAHMHGDAVTEKSRCPVCGMFVAKFPQWLAQVKMSDGTNEVFDGVKDMMAYFFSPQQFGAAEGVTVEQILVKAYYSQEWIDGKEALYVLGSDVYGPMGHELVPFSDKTRAESFLKDHHGQKVLSFSEISPEIVSSLRKGHIMKDHKMKKMK